MSSSRKKLRVAVIYGGRSGEHEISLRSAASVIRHLDRERFEVVPIAIDKKGRWLLNDMSTIESSTQSLPVYDNAPSVILPPNPTVAGVANLVPLSVPMSTTMSATAGVTGASSVSRVASSSIIDVVFPVMHGPLCEDGSIQGLLELTDLPYVGCGVLGSAVGMDKDVAKRLARDAGLPIVPWVAVKKESWERNPSLTAEQVKSQLGYPCFVKPANMGSSVGVHKVKEANELDAALKDAFQYDSKILIEKAINAREIEVAVLENPEAGLPPLASTAGEITPTHEFYSYESKYLDENGAALKIPAGLSPQQMDQVRATAQKVFTVLECEGMARVDFFVEKVTGELFFNEVNTIPGFTSISMYPKMWEASGIPYQELLSRLIDLAIARHLRKSKLSREFHGS
jgi:D-alanine-D-alanine ligase